MLLHGGKDCFTEWLLMLEDRFGIRIAVRHSSEGMISTPLEPKPHYTSHNASVEGITCHRYGTLIVGE